MKTIIDSDWISVDVIKNMLATRFKSTEWDLNDLIEWCMEVETLHLVNVDNMAHFVNVQVPVMNHRAAKPCNMFRLLDVYSNPGDNGSIVNNDPMSVAAWIKLDDDYTQEYVYLNYIGTMVDEKTGTLLINRDHRMACFYYCAKMQFMEMALTGQWPGQSYSFLEEQFSNACANAASIGDYRHMQRQDYMNLSIIQGNMLPVIGNTKLFQNGTGE